MYLMKKFMVLARAQPNTVEFKHYCNMKTNGVKSTIDMARSDGLDGHGDYASMLKEIIRVELITHRPKLV